MRIALLIGSVRAGSNTARAGAVIEAEINACNASCDLVDPRTLDLALPGMEADDRVQQALQKRVARADGVILITPEYDGSYSSVIKLLIEHLGYPSVLAGKPVHLLGVASGSIGAIKALEHLRSVCGSIGALLLPQSQSIDAVHQVFDASGACINPQAEKAIRSVPRQMLEHLRGG